MSGDHACDGETSGSVLFGDVDDDVMAGFSKEKIQWTPYIEDHGVKVVNIVSLSVGGSEDQQFTGPSQAMIDINSEYSFVPWTEFDGLVA